MLKMDLEYERGILFIRLKGQLNSKSSYKINRYLIPVINKHKIKYIIYNLFNLKSIDQSGINAILNTKYAIKQQKGKIYLCKVNKDIIAKIKRTHIKITSSELTALKMIEV